MKNNIRKLPFILLVVAFLSVSVFATQGNSTDWSALNGGVFKDKTMYQNSIAAQTPTGIRFVGKGGYSCTDGVATAACGGVFKIPVTVDSLKVEFSIIDYASINDTNEGGNWDSWLSFSLLNESNYFSVDANKGPKSITYLARFLNNNVIAMQMYNKKTSWTMLAEQLYEKVTFKSNHTIEFKRDTVEQVVDMYFDGIKYMNYQFDDTDISRTFGTTPVYFQISMQNQNINQLILAKDMKYNNFEVTKITTDGVVYNFGKSGTLQNPMPNDGTNSISSSNASSNVISKSSISSLILSSSSMNSTSTSMNEESISSENSGTSENSSILSNNLNESQGAYSNNNSSDESQSQTNEKGNNSIIFIIALIVLILGIAGAMVYFLVIKKS